jgi:23S rRNA pseudouridine2605 synthase
MQSRRPKPSRVSGKSYSSSSNPSFKKKSEGFGSSEKRPRIRKDADSFGSDRPDKRRDDQGTFGYLRKTNEKFSGDKRSPEDKGSSRGFKNSFGKRSDDVVARFEKSNRRFDGPKPDDRRFDSRSSSRPFEKKSFGEDRGETHDPRSPFKKREEGSERPHKRFGESNSSTFSSNRSDDRHSDSRGSFDKPYEKKSFGGERSGSRDSRSPYKKREDGSDRPAKRFGDSNPSPFSSSRPDDRRSESRGSFGKPYEKKTFGEERGGGRDLKRSPNRDQGFKPPKSKHQPANELLGMRLNRYISNSGVCARREADKLIEAGEIYVNGKVVTDFSYRVQEGDSVKYGSKTLKLEQFAYVLLNKPKDFLTTTDDPEERKTVMGLVKSASDARLYPVGRLDRNTTGLLIMTNDGGLADKLMHPSFFTKKIYQVDLDRPMSDTDLQKLQTGIVLEDGPIKADEIEIVSPDRKSVGIEIHSGRNRLVRRMFEHLEYVVVRLDRVMYAGLTKKDLPRGTWRHLTELEVRNLKNFS